MNDPFSYLGDYIQGKFVKVTDPNGQIERENPANLDEGKHSYPFRFEHAGDGVAAARRAFLSWRRMPPSDRKARIQDFRDKLDSAKSVFVETLCWELGRPKWEAEQEVVETLAYLDGLLAMGNPADRTQSVPSAWGVCDGEVFWRPRGVAMFFTPTDLPLYGLIRHLAPALENGNTAVVATSRYAPSVGQLVARVSHEAGFPAGVVNLIHGDFELSRRLASHEEVNLVYFAGSYEKGVKIRKQLLTDPSKLLVMETGSKNSTILWEDGDFDQALRETLFSCFVGSGQRYNCSRRVLVHQKLVDRFQGEFHQLAKKIAIGNQVDPNGNPAFMGPLSSEKAVSNYLSLQGIAVREGCEEIMRGKALERPERGYYVSPSIHRVLEPNPGSVYESSEVYGPNVSLYAFADLEEATRLLNQSPYGLLGAVYTQSEATFGKIREEAELSRVYWNLPTTVFTEQLPWGGLKKSGNLRLTGSLGHIQLSAPIGTLIRGETTVVDLPETLPR